MGYSTEFTGHVTVTPPLNPSEIAYLRKFNQTRRMQRTSGPYFAEATGSYGQGRDADITEYNRPDPEQPGLWCQWEPTDDGAGIKWDGCEKFTSADDWMVYLIEHFLRPDAIAEQRLAAGSIPVVPVEFEHFTFNHVINGRIEAQGEEECDTWALVVEDNEVCRIDADDEPEVSVDATLANLLIRVANLEASAGCRCPHQPRA